MKFRGETIIPPNCPAIRPRKDGVSVDDMELVFDAQDADDDVKMGRKITELVVAFLPRNPDGTAVDIFARAEDGSTPEIEVQTEFIPIDSPVAIAAHRIAGELGEDMTEVQERVRTILCDRIANCRGIATGECWALGPTGLGEAILAAVDATGDAQ